MTDPHDVRPGSRADRLTRPRARDLVTDAAIEAGVCIRPVLLRSIDTHTGETEVISTPCGSTRAAICPPCADRARRVRAQQCREGWHLEEEPDLTPRPGDDKQRGLVEQRAKLTRDLDDAREAVLVADPDPDDVARVDDLTDGVERLDDALSATGARGVVVPPVTRRKRSTKRRDDVPDLPRRAPVPTTLGRTFNDPKSGKVFRPSLFVTLTLPSYGRVGDDGTPVHPTAYDYRAAARDALHFGKLIDRWAQNLRRVAGYHVQYFAAVEPQKRGAPHVHFAIRGTLPRHVVRELTAATYVNVWWPATDTVHYTEGRLPVWDPDHGDQGAYLDPDTRRPLMTWDQALDDLDADEDAEPLHTARFGRQLDVKGVLAGSPDAQRAIGYLVKYLVKDLGDDLDQGDDPDDPDELPAGTRADAKARQARRADHIARLVEALRWEPCSPQCANWLRHGIQPRNARAGLRPGCCRAKAHKPSHLGYGGRRVLVSRKWTAKDLRDHRHDRRDHVHAVLAAAGITPDDRSATTPDGEPPRRIWELARPTDPGRPATTSPAPDRHRRRPPTANPIPRRCPRTLRHPCSAPRPGNHSRRHRRLTGEPRCTAHTIHS
jgi:hypothetical protein